MEPDNGNGRVTMAVLRSDVQHLTDLVRAHFEADEMVRKDHEARLRTLETWRPQVEERQRNTTWLLTALSVIGNAIAAVVGSKP